ncbi:hypothetical protein GGS20DRAFT_576211 [Poronia punctata]|nr:hypothetical protein GGS20DRAFT_576211 [Poronia punctata]
MSATHRSWATVGLLAFGVGSASGNIVNPYPYPSYSVPGEETTLTLPTLSFPPTETETWGYPPTTYPPSSYPPSSYPPSSYPPSSYPPPTSASTISLPTVSWPTCHATVTITVSETLTIVTPSPTTTTETETETETETVTTVIPTTKPTTIIVPTTKPTTIPTTLPTTITIPTTIPTTLPTTITIPTTLTTSVYEECPKTCSVEAGTVRLFYWPTSESYTYPSTWVDEGLGYTFTSPSVYMVINTIYGTNAASGRVGPQATNKIFAADLDELSTIDVKDGATRQLTLNDLKTNCPQSVPASVIATTIPDGHCDFSLLAPSTVKEWASPCNACGRLGLFDPPYAIPTIEATTTTVVVTTPTPTEEPTVTEEPTTIVTPSPSSSLPSPTASTTEEIPVTSTFIPTGEVPTGGESSTEEVPTTTSTFIPTGEVPTGGETTTSTFIPTGEVPTGSPYPTGVPTGAASQVAGFCGAAWLFLGVFVMIWL